MMHKSIALTCLSLFFVQLASAQETITYQELLNQSNKMIAVILVLLIILLGIAVFLFFMDKKIKNLEDQIKKS